MQQVQIAGELEGRMCLLGRKGARVAGTLPYPALYEYAHPQADTSCGFRDFFRNLRVGRRDAYLSSSTHLPGGDIRHPPSGFDICRLEDIYTAEAELTIELGCVVYDSPCA